MERFKWLPRESPSKMDILGLLHIFWHIFIFITVKL